MPLAVLKVPQSYGKYGMCSYRFKLQGHCIMILLSFANCIQELLLISIKINRGPILDPGTTNNDIKKLRFSTVYEKCGILACVNNSLQSGMWLIIKKKKHFKGDC